MPRILHTADWQVGRQYNRFAVDDAVALAEARFSTVERIAELATKEQVDAVLVAGDIFDAQTVSERTIRRLFNAMQGFTGPWMMLPGNHDAALAESVWTRAARIGAIPANVQVLLEPYAYPLTDLGLVVLAAPLAQRQTYDDLTEWFDTAETDPALLRIGIAHGSIQGMLPDEVDSPNPIAPDRALRARLEYLALGDWHGLKQINARTYYSGSPEQERFKDNGAGQVLLVDIPGAGQQPLVESRSVGQYRWQQWSEQLSVASDLDRLIERIEASDDKSVLSISLSGQIDLLGQQRLKDALSIAEARHRSVQCNMAGLRFEPTDDDIAALQADGYVGEVIAELRERQLADGSQDARDALVIIAGLLRERNQEGRV
ncbi:DNA repair exonuclease [Pseudomonas aeruginosa]|uniref:metallophosphoesterase family protein n=1 Tax=Pseudomonas aeruginosa TaxID=287 RepID=UPI00345AB4B3|nr:DNA repair exonuclease [Pseudomonas aeruginosa]HBP1969500.1 DNA repair exonuclease [Pseudomonas aeruginosa]